MRCLNHECHNVGLRYRLPLLNWKWRVFVRELVVAVANKHFARYFPHGGQYMPVNYATRDHLFADHFFALVAER